MKRQAMATAAGLAFLLVAGVASGFGQATFKVAFPFKAGGKKLAAGEYTIAGMPGGQLALRQHSTGKETMIAAIERIAQPVPPVAEPRLVFDEVGDFEPSYTEYFTVTILAEVWLPGEDGFRVHVTKGAHQTKTVKGEAAKS